MFADFLTAKCSQDLLGCATATNDKHVKLDRCTFIDYLASIDKNRMSPLLANASFLSKDKSGSSQTILKESSEIPGAFDDDSDTGEILSHADNENLKKDDCNSHYRFSVPDAIDPDLIGNTVEILKVQSDTLGINDHYPEMLNTSDEHKGKDGILNYVDNERLKNEDDNSHYKPSLTNDVGMDYKEKAVNVWKENEGFNKIIDASVIKAAHFDDHNFFALLRQPELNVGNHTGLPPEKIQSNPWIKYDIDLQMPDKISREHLENSNFIVRNSKNDQAVETQENNNTIYKSSLINEENVVLKQNNFINISDQSINNRIDHKKSSDRICLFNRNENASTGFPESSIIQDKTILYKGGIAERIQVAGNISNVDLIKLEDPSLGHSSHDPSKISDMHFNVLKNDPIERPLKNEILSQIVDKAVITLKGSNNEIRINLKPEIFGHLHLNITTDNNQVTAKILTEFPFVREIIESNIGQLRSALQVHGFDIDQINVSVTDDYDQYNGYFRRHSSNSFQYNEDDMASDPNTIDEQDEDKHIVEEETGDKVINYFI